MPTTRPRVPGWHPDPEDPASLRHWDGRRWGAERRPRPSWAAPAPAVTVANLAPGRRRRRRRLVVTVAAASAVVLLLALVASLRRGPEIPERTVEDASFTRRADAVCARALPPLRRERPRAREDTGTPEQFAGRIDRAADGLQGVTRELRALPVAQADGAEVDRWLDDWDAYVASGRRYAAALRQGDRPSQGEAGREGNRLATRIFVFAKANGMPNCTL